MNFTNCERPYPNKSGKTCKKGRAIKHSKLLRLYRCYGQKVSAPKKSRARIKRTIPKVRETERETKKSEVRLRETKRERKEADSGAKLREPKSLRGRVAR